MIYLLVVPDFWAGVLLTIGAEVVLFIIVFLVNVLRDPQGWSGR